ncbi:hypothetical protein [Thermomonas alba]|uniref:hypothetical protein n=1 Tax=Thermomonas alba TaxID=2888525 RepID=UPI001F039683|nr:hypothetical protein [Thermomonas alba]
MPLQFLLKTIITVALVLLASGLAKRPGLLAALAGFAGMSAVQFLLTHFKAHG